MLIALIIAISEVNKMKKNLLILPLILLGLASCTPTSNNSEEVTNNDFEKALRSEITFPTYSTTYIVKKDGKQIIYNYFNHMVDLENKIEFESGSQTVFNSIDSTDPLGVSKTSVNKYYTSSHTYILGSDGKYQASENTSKRNIDIYAFKYNLEGITKTVEEQSKAEFTATVNQDKYASFLNLEDVSKISNVNLHAELIKNTSNEETNIRLNKFNINYVQSGYEISLETEFNYFKNTLTLPKI